MKNENINKSLEIIRDYISSMKDLKESTEVQMVRSQLRLMEKTIKQFEKGGIQAPEGILSDKALLESKMNEVSKVPQELTSLYGELLDIIILIAGVLKTWPVNDLRNRIKAMRKKELPPEKLRENIIAVLGEMGGSGGVRDVIKEIGDRLKEQFSPSDMEAPYGKRPRWEMNARRERNRMIKEGILAPESKGKVWSLTKHG